MALDSRMKDEKSISEGKKLVRGQFEFLGTAGITGGSLEKWAVHVLRSRR